MERIVLHLDMNAFFASVEQQANPRLRSQPVLVCGNRHSRTVVATASYEARAFGVKTGMSLSEARALCPQAVVVEGHPARYADLFRRIAQMMERYSPTLEICSIDEAFLDVTDTAERFGGPLVIAHALHRQVQETFGLPCSIGLGPNKLIAKLASSRKKPNGITQFRPEDIPAALHDLPIEELCGIGPALQAALNAQGITTCGELAQIEPARLVRWFGRSAGLHLARLARGLDDHPVVPTEKTPLAKSMGHLHTLSRDTSRPAIMRAVLLDLSEKVGRRLRAERAAGRTVTVTVRVRDFTAVTRSRTLIRFLDDGMDIYEAGCGILEGVWIDQPVRMLGICVSNLAYGARQLEWMPAMAARRRLLDACDRIHDRFGEASLSRGTLVAPLGVGAHYQLKRGWSTPQTLLRV